MSITISTAATSSKTGSRLELILGFPSNLNQSLETPPIFSNSCLQCQAFDHEGSNEPLLKPSSSSTIAMASFGHSASPVINLHLHSETNKCEISPEKVESIYRKKLVNVKFSEETETINKPKLSPDKIIVLKVDVQNILCSFLSATFQRIIGVSFTLLRCPIFAFIICIDSTLTCLEYVF